jgi:arylformamidase
VSRLRDISVPIWPGLASFPGNPAPSVTPVMRRDRGDAANVSLLGLGSHAGTHVDAPIHLLGGTSGVDEVPLEALVGEALVVACDPPGAHMDAACLARLGFPAGTERLLLQTRNSQHWDDPGAAYPTDYVGLTDDGARWLVAHGIRLVGTDGLSIEPFATPGRPTHRALLGAGVVIVEGLDLRGVPPGTYTLVCLPLRWRDGDGGPARAILMDA